MTSVYTLVIISLIGGSVESIKMDSWSLCYNAAETIEATKAAEAVCVKGAKD